MDYDLTLLLNNYEKYLQGKLKSQELEDTVGQTLDRRGFSSRDFKGQTFFYNSHNEGDKLFYYFLNPNPEAAELWKVPFEDNLKFNAYMAGGASDRNAPLRCISEVVGGTLSMLYLGNGQESIAAELMKGGFFIFGGISSGLSATVIFSNYFSGSGNYELKAVGFEKSIRELAELNFPVLTTKSQLPVHNYE